MTQASERSRFRRFVFASAERRLSPYGDSVSVTSARLGRVYRLDPTEFEIAKLFDGTRDARAIRNAAAELGYNFNEIQIEALAGELAQSDLLLAGSEEPLPVPPQRDEEARAIGWTAMKPDMPPPAPTNVVPPSTAPGSRAGAALPGTMGGTIAAVKGTANDIVHPVSLAPFLFIGNILSLFVRFLPLTIVLVLVTCVMIYEVDAHQAVISQDLLRLGSVTKLAAFLLIGAWVANFFAKVTRAAVIKHYTGDTPRFGLTYWLQFFPWFSVATNGLPEKTGLSTRVRIIGAVPATELLVLNTSLLMYFSFYHSGTMVAPMMLGIALMAFVMLVIGLNPLLKRDLYALVATLLRTPDLREQSIAALFGYSRPWQRGPTLSQSQMSAYILVCLGYMVFIISMIINGPATWINLAWGPTGTIVFVFLIVVLIYDVYRRIGQNRGSIGNIRLEMPGVWFWLIAFTLAALALAPYTYEPSGQFQVVAHHQVDIRALTAGNVTTVYVKEGQQVQEGTLLMKLNDYAQVAAVAESEGNLGSLQHQLAIALAGHKPEEIDEAKQKVAMAQKKYDFSLAESNRVDAAFRRNAASAQQRDQAVGQTAVDREALEVARKQLDVVQSPTRSDEVEALKAQISKAEAQLAFSKQQLAYTEVRAPIAGHVVAQVLLNPIGHYFNNGDLIATVVDDSKLYAQIFMPEVEMGDLQLGAHVRVKAYAYPGTEFYGKVDDIAPAAQTSTQGVVGNPDNAGQSQSGYNVIRVLCEIDDPQHRLRPDMTGMAKVSGRSVPAGEAFLRPLIRALMVEVWSWLP